MKVPVKFIVGDLNMVYTTLGTKEYIHNGGFKKDVPFLEDAFVMGGWVTSSTKKKLRKSALTSMTSLRSSNKLYKIKKRSSNKFC